MHTNIYFHKALSTQRAPRGLRAGLALLLLCFVLIPGLSLADSPSRLFSGLYPGLSEALAAAQGVQGRIEGVGIVRDREAEGYRLLLAESADPTEILAAQRTAQQAGLRGLQVVLADGPLVMLPAGHGRTRDFNDLEVARQEAMAVRGRGELADVEPVHRDVGLTSVQLIGYTRRADAQRDVRALNQAGIESQILSSTYERGFSVSAGVFRGEDNARELARQLLARGFSNTRLVPLRGSVESYRLVTVTRDAPPRPAPSSIGLTPSAPSAEGGVLVLGSAQSAPTFAMPAMDADTGGMRVGLDQLRAETGWLPDDGARADGSHYLHASVLAEWPLSDRWSARLAARVDSYLQTGESDFDRTELDYGESYLRYREPGRRVTLGAQSVLWGKVDELPPTDRLSVQDASRFMLDDLQDRRRAVLAARWEEFVGDYKVDLLYVPLFRAAEMPHEDSIWSPVDRSRGRIIGMPANPLMAPLVSQGRFTEDDGGSGGWGIRLSHAGRGMDYAFTVQDARHSLPYYELNPQVRAALLTNPMDIPGALAAAPDTFTARHPRTWVVGGDLGFSLGRSTWRFEGAWLSDQPVTTEDLRFTTVEAFDWVAGVEFFPGDADFRVNLQLGGLHLLDTEEPLLDREDIYTLFGDAENTFVQNRWRARLRFSLGLDKRDTYINPEVAFISWEPHEIYLGYHHFDGAENTLGGFHRNHDLLTLGWRARY